MTRSTARRHGVSRAIEPDASGSAACVGLGLRGEITADSFAALCDNLHPLTREKLTVRNKANRTVGYDINFHPPKSLSIVHAITRDVGLVEALRVAARRTMDLIEADAETRVRIAGKDENRRTGNLVRAEFLHETTRPVDGIPDPHLHIHCFVFNSTFDEVEDRWKAGQFRSIKQNAPYYQAIFHATLAANLEARGYALERRSTAIGSGPGAGAGYELAGISDTLIEKFSRRTDQIERAAEKRGITSAKQKSMLGAQTREPKRDDLSAADLQTAWRSRLIDEDLRAIDRHRDPIPPTRAPRLAEPELMADALRYSKEYNFERQSVVDENRIVIAALRYGMGRLDPVAIRSAIEADPEFVRRELNGRAQLTTDALIQEEQELIGWVKKHHGTEEPLAPDYDFPHPSIADDHRAAAEHVLRSRDRVTGILGKAGTGKTTLMRTTIAAMEERGHRVVVLAPTAETGRGILRDVGFAEANTVSHLLTNSAAQKQAAGAVWWVDEAGLLSLGDMTKLMDLADELGARVVLSGDTGQHRAVRRGDALRLLVEHADLDMARLTKIRRQKGEYKEAVEALSENRLLEAFRKLDAMGVIHEIEGPGRHQFIADRYLEIRKRGESVLIVSPTHSEGRKVTRLVRDGLKTAGEITGERTFPNLQRFDLRDADLQRVETYEPGMILEMVADAPGHDRGIRVVVDAIIDGDLYVQHNDGSRRYFDVKNWLGAYQVFQRDEIQIGIGDEVRITKNGYDTSRRPLTNGMIHKVVGFTEAGDIRLHNGQTVSQEFAHLSHGYVTTSYAAQGKTVAHVLIAESSESFPAASREQLYVAASRGQIDVCVVTDDKEGLFDAAERSSGREMATKLSLSQHCANKGCFYRTPDRVHEPPPEPEKSKGGLEALSDYSW